MSWAQHDNALQKTVTFTDKKKIAYNYSDPGGSTTSLLTNVIQAFQGCSQCCVAVLDHWGVEAV